MSYLITTMRISTATCRSDKLEDDEKDNELVDPQEKLKKICGEKPMCQNYNKELQICEERVNSKKHTEENCTQELFDFLHCIDKCVSQELFNYLK